MIAAELRQTVAPRRFGATPDIEGTHVRLWAPSMEAVELVRPDHAPVAMRREAGGFFAVDLPGAVEGTRYRFQAGGVQFPDPASRGQEQDAEGWSVVQAAMPAGSGRAIRPWREAVIAEVHVGAATPEGTFSGLARRLDHFVQAGFTALEIMPVNDFVGRWNWGYDGVLPYAPDRSYGRPEDLRALVDAAHARGLGVVLDVVYNHFGPAGNYLHHYAKAFFAEREMTPWGPAIALDRETVRAFFVDNATMWLEDYDMDGLRFDAVHAFRTAGAPRLLEELAEGCRTVKPDAWLILENDDNGARWLKRREDGQPRRFSAQWNDDYHHVFTVAAGRDTTAHLADYAEDTPALAARALAEGFVYQGEVGPHRGSPRGEPSAELPPDAFVAFVQNHDQIGNRPLGDRLPQRLSPDQVRCLRFCVMLGPQIPLLFMGEEALVETPFPFFCDFSGDLGEAVRRGRREEFRPFFETHKGSTDDLPDPIAQNTFQSAKLDWDGFETPTRRAALEEFRGLASTRRQIVWPLAATPYRRAAVERDGDAIAVTWTYDAGRLTLAVNLSDRPGTVRVGAAEEAASIGTARRESGRVAFGAWSAMLLADRTP
jgi:malto-oligosyltrehalose trehalohydrolase